MPKTIRLGPIHSPVAFRAREVVAEVLQPSHLLDTIRDPSNKPTPFKKRITRSHPNSFFTGDRYFLHRSSCLHLHTTVFLTVSLLILIPRQQRASQYRCYYILKNCRFLMHRTFESI